jgi:hypothetical protein
LSDQSVRERADALLQQTLEEKGQGSSTRPSGVSLQGAIKEVSDDAVAKGQVGSILWQVE